MADGNGTPNENSAPPQLNVLAQYVKDFSFENPNSPASLQPSEKAPQINISVNVGATNIGGTDYEVTLSIEGKGMLDTMLIFGFEILYGGVFRIQNVDQENLHPLIMIECPRLLFPFAREIIATATRNGGFPPLMLDPIDFASMYFAQQQQQGGVAGHA
jgi:preprotein translocase subunit SecB